MPRLSSVQSFFFMVLRKKNELWSLPPVADDRLVRSFSVETRIQNHRNSSPTRHVPRNTQLSGEREPVRKEAHRLVAALAPWEGLVLAAQIEADTA